MRERRAAGSAAACTGYGDPAVSLYLSRSLAGSMGYADEMLERPIGCIAASPARSPARRGCDRLYHAHVLLADEGCEFDFC